MGKIVRKEKKWIFTTTSLHHTTLVLICIRFTCPRCYSEGQEDRLVGRQRHRHKCRTLLMLCGTSPQSSPPGAPLTHRLNSHTTTLHFSACVLTTSDIFLNIARCDFSSGVWFLPQYLSVRWGHLAHTLHCPRHTEPWWKTWVEAPLFQHKTFCLTRRRLKLPCQTLSIESASQTETQTHTRTSVQVIVKGEHITFLL